jgi:hypothetical protein
MVFYKGAVTMRLRVRVCEAEALQVALWMSFSLLGLVDPAGLASRESRASIQARRERDRECAFIHSLRG